MGSEKKAGQTVQEHIDETPLWADGTTVPQVPMTRMQWQIWGLATAGKFFEGLVVFMTGVALPLMTIDFHLNAMEKGMVGAAALFGILVGATALGGLADHLGRKQLFIAEMILFLVFLVAMTLSPSFPFMLVWRSGAITRPRIWSYQKAFRAIAAGVLFSARSRSKRLAC